MRVTVQPSTGVNIEVWRSGPLFHAKRADSKNEPQVCIALDLFEVIAELAGLDLDRPIDAEEATRLSRVAQKQLSPD
jgi:hypothetical protein